MLAGEFIGPPRGLMRQVGDPPIPLCILWAPVCHLPVPSLCPELQHPTRSISYNDILSYSSQPSMFNINYSPVHAAVVFSHRRGDIHDNSLDSLGLQAAEFNPL